MKEVTRKIASLHWEAISAEMHDKGYALAPQLITATDCAGLINEYNNASLYRKTITMERYRFGLGEYKYFNYPLPPLIDTIRQEVYPHLSAIANKWMEVLQTGISYPPDFGEFRKRCHQEGQTKPTVLILQYGQGGHNTLHQDLYGNIFFPIQVVLFLTEPGKDHEGGEFVLVEQRPRAQSKAIVLQPGKGDMLIFTTNFRPVKGSKGYYRVNMKHGVSEVRKGNRYTLGIIFHDAA